MTESGLKEQLTENRFEIICGITIAIFAAGLAITDLGAGKFGEDEIIAHNEKANAYQWYNAKSIKENLAEGEKNIIDALIKSGAVQEEKENVLKSVVKGLDVDLSRYSKEKKEILLGSESVGKNGWAQDVEGKMGQIIGAKTWEQRSDRLNAAGDSFDWAVLFLQLCLVIGAIILVMKNERLKNNFFRIMVLLGLIGTGVSIRAFIQALSNG
jgi:hypothetical protein